MNDDLEPRLHRALHSGPLPSAPASLFEALERVPDAPVRPRSRRRGGSVIALLAAAAVLVVASGVALTGGSTPRPGPAAQSPDPSVAVSVAPGEILTRLAYTALPAGGVTPTKTDLAAIVSIMERRLAATGLADWTITVGGQTISVELPGVSDTDAIRKLIGQTGKVEFVPLGQTQVDAGQPIDPATYPPLFGGDQIASATPGTDQDGHPALDLVLKPDGARLFGEYTAAHVGSYFAITLDDVVVTAPVIQNAIPNGDVQITGGGPGGFSAEEVSRLVTILRSGPLPYPVSMTSSSVVGGSSPEPSEPVASGGP